MCLTAMKTMSQCKNVSLCSGGEKVLLHFVQKTPADNASLEDITKALGISVNVQAGEKPQVKQDAFVRSDLFDTGI